MDRERAQDLSCPAKLARVVLENCGPLSASEVAAEARLETNEAAAGLTELAEHDLAQPVCSVRTTREQVYELRE